jgi:hypothetical protein
VADSQKQTTQSMERSQEADSSQPPHSTRDIVISTMDERLSVYRERLKYFVLGFGCFLLLLTSVDMLSKKEIFRELHKLAFPIEMPDQTPTSYSSTLILKASDPRRRSDMVAFYATQGQDVQAYAYANYRFVGTGQLLPIVVTVDDTLSGEPTTSFDKKFQNITPLLRFNRHVKSAHISWQGEPNIHHVGFSIASVPSSGEQDLEITITCIVHVFERK